MTVVVIEEVEATEETTAEVVEEKEVEELVAEIADK
jgi:hypothetical protein